MLLAALLADLDARGGAAGTIGLTAVRGGTDVEITSVAHDSRRVRPGALYCCVPGRSVDGHDYAADAVAAGAGALLVERPVGVGVPELEVTDVRRAMGPVADVVHGHPSRHLDVVGVTGTNGKTTVTYLLESVLAEAGRPSAVLGTLSGARTTPEAPELQAWLADRVAEGVEVVAMEVSSHALDMHRVAGTRFRVAVFTNLSRDHLDYHGTMEEYFRAKARLFEPDYATEAVVNLDSPHGRMLRDAARVPTRGYSLDDVDGLELGVAGSSFVWRGVPVSIALAGRFNVANALAAAETALVLGVDAATAARGLSRPIVVPGRFERIDEGQDFTVAVDFAHTPDGLEQLLRSADEVVAAGGRVHVVFGCGGDRDPSKRAPMGEVAAARADRVVLTADNSRGESTGAIIDAIRRGFDSVSPRRAAELVIEPDRARAIGVALDGAAPGDVVLIAGKGHESTQTVGGAETPFDDREVARLLLRERIGGAR